ncbi:Alkanesulfonates transport system permease protein [Collimonas arenae]|uniref:Alkanesulfonates transport system permease protein n=1 Tax=Collimonas arenae TaxID=279058 RepID=A0A0A1F8C4_9BURK|nr:ABC transporter permease [Collimonas arenae]AIY40983.1 Alkanesulfonates transport system permease protein [Collimonas arenae]
MWKALKPSYRNLRIYQLLVLLLFFALWHLATRNPQTAFFFGEPVKVLQRVWQWFTVGSGTLEIGFGDHTWFTLTFPAEIYAHLLVTLTETMLAFGIGTVFGLAVGLWLALSPLTSAILDPYIKASNAMPRVILAPIFAMWFGLGIWSKVALAVTLVFFIVFFNVYQGVREVSPVVLANARMLGANQRQLLRTVYLPSATSWVFSSLHTSVGLAFVGVIVGEYLGSARGVGYLILQAEGAFDINTVFAGILVLTAFALVLDTVVGMIEKRLMKWQPKSGETERL